MPSPRIDSIEAANKVFIAESKKITSTPTPAQKKAVVTRLVNDLSHMPRNAEDKKSVLIRLGKFLKKPAYKLSLIVALQTAGIFTHLSVIGTKYAMNTKRQIVSNPLASLAIRAENSLNPLPFGIRRTTAFDLAVVAGGISTLYGIEWTVKALKRIGVEMRNDYRIARNARIARMSK